MYIFIAFLSGLFFGSFANVVAMRLHEKKPGILFGSSACPKCNHQLSALENIPLFSWLFLQGKCRKCQEPISWQYPLVEIFFGLLFAITTYFIGLENKLVLFFYLLIIFALGILFISDLLYTEVPDEVSVPTIFLLIILLFFDIFTVSLFSAFVGAAVIYLFFAMQILIPSCFTAKCTKALVAIFTFPVWLCFYILGLKNWYEKNIEKPTKEQEIELESWIGGGDLRLAIIIGLLLGWQVGILAVFLAYLFGTLVAIPLLMFTKKKIKSQIAFGPFLLTATIICLFFGQQILNSYLKIVGLE